MKKFLVISAVVAMSGQYGSAQSVATAQGSSVPAARSGALSDSKITLSLRDVRVGEALRAVARQADLRVTFGDKVLGISRRVTVNAHNSSVDSVIKDIIKGTGVTMSVTQTGQLFFEVPDRQSGKAQGVIAGKVTDAKTGKGVQGANVSIGNDIRGSVSGEYGSYRISGVSSGAHTVTVRSVGYAKQTRTITVGEGATVTADFKLEPSASVLDQVIVTGTISRTELRAVPNAITVITAKQIEERGITRIDQLFRGDIPGLFSANYGTSPFSLLDEVVMFSRGATALTSRSAGLSAGINTNPIKTYIDGVEMADSKYLSQIDPRSIERIEILTGPQASTIYGANAINGVMQIFTKRGNISKPQITLGLTSGAIQNNFSSHLAPSHIAESRVSGNEGKLSYNVGGAWDYTGAWTPAKQTQRLSFNGGARMGMGKLTTDVSTRYGLTKNRQRGEPSQGAADLIGEGIFAPLFVLTPPNLDTRSLKGRTFGLNLSFVPLSWWSHELVLGIDASDTDRLRTPSYASAVSSSDSLFILSASNSSRVSQRYTATAQFPVSSFIHLNLVLGGDHWRSAISSWTANTLQSTGTLNSPSVTRAKPEKNSGAFIQGQLSLRDALFFTYGVRGDWNPSFGDRAKVKPGRYGVSYARDLDTPIGPVSSKLRGSYGRAIRPPAPGLSLAQVITSPGQITNFGVYDRILANHDLGPEYQQGGEGGIELYFGSRSSIIVTRYNQTVDNLISQVGGVDSVRSIPTLVEAGGNPINFPQWTDGYFYARQDQYLNVGSIRNQGWELQGSVNTGPFTTRSTYSWTKSRILGITPKYKTFLTGTDFQRGRSFDYMPEHTWALGITYARAASMVSVTVNGTSMLYRGSPNSDELAAGATFNRLPSNKLRMSMPTDYRQLGSGYATADLNATQRFGSRFDALLQITNITNHYQNDNSVLLAAIGRQTKVGARVRWQ